LLVVHRIIDSGSCSEPLLITHISTAVQNMNHC
jgi:hypothetical protein